MVSRYSGWVGLGGWSWGPRFLVPVIAPAVTLAVVAVGHATGGISVLGEGR